jgi:hypothetical protein
VTPGTSAARRPARAPWFLTKLHPEGFLVSLTGDPGLPRRWVRQVSDGESVETFPETDRFTDAEVAGWPDVVAVRAPGVPVGRRLPPVVPPERYATESLPVYDRRVFRWRVWLDAEPRPDMWFADPDDDRAYGRWRDSDPIVRGVDGGSSRGEA